MIVIFAVIKPFINAKSIFMSQNLKYGLYALLGGYLIYSIFFSSPSASGTTTEEVALPTQGLITVVQEVEADQFKIADEQTIADTSASLIVAKYLDGRIDTFTLAEARLMSGESGGRSTGSSIARAASYGLMGYFMGRSMGSRPSPGAYVDQKTYNKVSNGAGNKMQNSAARKTVTRRPSGTSGHGSGRSTRSVGG